MPGKHKTTLRRWRLKVEDPEKFEEERLKQLERMRLRRIAKQKKWEQEVHTRAQIQEQAAKKDAKRLKDRERKKEKYNKKKIMAILGLSSSKSKAASQPADKLQVVVSNLIPETDSSAGPSSRKSVGKVPSQTAGAARIKRASSSSVSSQGASLIGLKATPSSSVKNGVGKQPLGLSKMPPIGDNAKKEVQKIIEDHELVVFSKSWCPFCTKVSSTL
ncbi:hypothetical protein ElyMa_000804100 [Elysia marginata]|uniref:Glutaredoxin domain-containing protein n=1 Tax=Elysia marginata TaxID=1093978 RepID=A0AAV4GVD1_9GAST|nr:hypothetical protein ElyMa_000804100 [Elysia marginata]